MRFFFISLDPRLIADGSQELLQRLIQAKLECKLSHKYSAEYNLSGICPSDLSNKYLTHPPHYLFFSPLVENPGQYCPYNYDSKQIPFLTFRHFSA